MKYEVLCVFDAAVGAFMRPIFTQSVGQAVRSFSDEVNRVDDANTMRSHPNDFALWHLGSFEDSNASFDLLSSPARVSRASEVLIDSK